MAVALDYQAVYGRRNTIVISVRAQIIAATLLLAALVIKVFLVSESTRIGYILAEERRKTIQLDMQKQELEFERSVLLRGDNLKKVAEKNLKLMPLNPAKVRKIVY